MRRITAMLTVLGMLSIVALAAVQEGADPPPRRGPQGGAGDAGGPPRPDAPGGPPGGFHLIPRFAVEKLNLTDDQLKQIAELEKEVKDKLGKILTPEQRKILEEARPPRPGQGGPGQGGRRGPGGGGPGGQGGPSGGGPGDDGGGGGQGGPGGAGGPGGGGQGQNRPPRGPR